jgi:transaldolase
MEGIDVYYDGTNIANNCGNDIKGFTTNISFLKASGINDYEKFILDSLKYTKGRPISFQLYDDNDDDIYNTASKISSYNPSSIFVKVPVIKSTGDYNTNIIKELHDDGIKVNVTAIFTKNQINTLTYCFGKENDVIISIFGGRINDSGVDCSDIVKYAVDTFKDYPNVKILWAACRTIYNMFEAKNQGSHIVTVPESVLSRMNRIGDELETASLNTVKQFRQDGLNGNINFI